jgi:hypothetical protein
MIRRHCRTQQLDYLSWPPDDLDAHRLTADPARSCRRDGTRPKSGARHDVSASGSSFWRSCCKVYWRISGGSRPGSTIREPTGAHGGDTRKIEASLYLPGLRYPSRARRPTQRSGRPYPPPAVLAAGARSGSRALIPGSTARQEACQLTVDDGELARPSSIASSNEWRSGYWAGPSRCRGQRRLAPGRSVVMSVDVEAYAGMGAPPKQPRKPWREFPTVRPRDGLCRAAMIALFWAIAGAARLRRSAVSCTIATQSGHVAG